MDKDTNKDDINPNDKSQDIDDMFPSRGEKNNLNRYNSPSKLSKFINQSQVIIN